MHAPVPEHERDHEQGHEPDEAQRSDAARQHGDDDAPDPDEPPHEPEQRPDDADRPDDDHEQRWGGARATEPSGDDANEHTPADGSLEADGDDDALERSHRDQ